MSFLRGNPCGIIVKMLDCEIVESKFKFQLRYYDHFLKNHLGKGMNLFTPACHGLNSIATILLQGYLKH